MPTASVLVVIEGIYRYQFKSNYLKNHRLFAAFFFFFFLHVWYLYQISNVLEKNEPQRASVLKLLTQENVPI